MPRIWRPAISTDLDDSLKTSGDSAQPTSFGAEVIPVMQWPPPCEGFRSISLGQTVGQQPTSVPVPPNVMRYVTFADARLATADAVLQRFVLCIVDDAVVVGAVAPEQTANQVGARSILQRPIIIPPRWQMGVQAFGSGAFTTLSIVLTLWFKDFKLTEHLPPY